MKLILALGGCAIAVATLGFVGCACATVVAHMYQEP
jgi:hypothetical protein